MTVVAEATRAIRSAHVEAESSPNGIGLVKLMGRHSGFIACYASLAMSDTNFVLIPEVAFELEGAGGFLKVLRERLERRGHAVVVVALSNGAAPLRLWGKEPMPPGVAEAQRYRRAS